MNKPTGGRGHKAPYETTHVRVPVPIKSLVDQMVEDYRKVVMESSVADSEQLPQPFTGMLLTSYEEAIELARKIKQRKKSAPQALAMLLTALYGIKVNEKEL